MTLESLLGGIINTMRSMESDLIENLMCHMSDYMFTLYYNFKHVHYMYYKFKIPLIFDT